MKKLNYCLMITHSSYNNQISGIALQFSLALLEIGHYIDTIFFYQNGVYNINCLLPKNSEEISISNAWKDFSKKYQIPLYFCISSAIRRGISTKKNKKYEENKKNKFGFYYSGLGKLSKSILFCDRFIQF